MSCIEIYEIYAFFRIISPKWHELVGEKRFTFYTPVDKERKEWYWIRLRSEEEIWKVSLSIQILHTRLQRGTDQGKEVHSAPSLRAAGCGLRWLCFCFRSFWIMNVVLHLSYTQTYVHTYMCALQVCNFENTPPPFSFNSLNAPEFLLFIWMPPSRFFYFPTKTLLRFPFIFGMPLCFLYLFECPPHFSSISQKPIPNPPAHNTTVLFLPTLRYMCSKGLCVWNTNFPTTMTHMPYAKILG